MACSPSSLTSLPKDTPKDMRKDTYKDMHSKSHLRTYLRSPKWGHNERHSSTNNGKKIVPSYLLPSTHLRIRPNHNPKDISKNRLSSFRGLVLHILLQHLRIELWCSVLINIINQNLKVSRVWKNCCRGLSLQERKESFVWMNLTTHSLKLLNKIFPYSCTERLVCFLM